MQKKLLSLGAIAMDIVLDSHELPKDDGFALIKNEVMLPGGSASNVSVCASHLGMDVYQTGKVGDDETGREFLRTLKEDGVDGTHVAVKKGGTSLHTYIITAPGGKHCIFANTGDTVCTLEPEELPEDLMDSMDIFYNDMFSPKAALWLAQKAVSQGKPVIYNMQCVPSFMDQCGTSMKDIEEMMKLCTVFISGRDGFREMTGEDDYRNAMRIIQDRYHIQEGVICTAGSEGAIWLCGQEIEVPAYQVEAVDTTGAGDCFLGGFIYAYFCEEAGKEEALEFANATAAIKCTQAGPRSRASADQVQQFRNSAKGDPE